MTPPSNLMLMPEGLSYWCRAASTGLFPAGVESAEHNRYQSEYFVPSKAVPVDLEYTSKTLFPPQPVASGSSCTERIPQSALPVIGSTGIRRSIRIFSEPLPPYEIPSTRVCRSGGYPSLPTSTRMRVWSARSLYWSIALRISRRLWRSSFSLERTTVNRNRGRAAEASISRIAQAIISSSNVTPASYLAIRLRALTLSSRIVGRLASDYAALSSRGTNHSSGTATLLP